MSNDCNTYLRLTPMHTAIEQPLLFEPPDSSFSSECTSSRDMNLMTTRLANGETFNAYHDPEFWIFIALLLFYLSIAKILHRHFDKVRHDLHTFMLR